MTKTNVMTLSLKNANLGNIRLGAGGVFNSADISNHDKSGLFVLDVAKLFGFAF